MKSSVWKINKKGRKDCNYCTKIWYKVLGTWFEGKSTWSARIWHSKKMNQVCLEILQLSGVWSIHYQIIHNLVSVMFSYKFWGLIFLILNFTYAFIVDIFPWFPFLPCFDFKLLPAEDTNASLWKMLVKEFECFIVT